MNPFDGSREWAGRFPVVVIAHRGASGVAPENTQAAFRAAIAAGADMVELDVHPSRDGEVVVIHDDTVGRRTDGTGRVAEMTRAELQRLDAGGWFDERFRGETIPTLDQVLQLARGRIGVNVEIKGGSNDRFSLDDLVDRTIAVVENHRMFGEVLFSSFSPPALARVARLRPDAARALLLDTPWQEAPGPLLAGFRLLHLKGEATDERSLAAARERGICVNVWTVNREAEMERFICAGAHGIITDHPDRLIRLLERRGARPAV